nr:site-specific DNA-methyltransferase [Ruminococcus bromii]
MDKLKMQTVNKADENFKKLADMFPNAVTEAIDENGEVVRAIDKDVLMQEINTKVVDGNEERYQFTWPDKKKSVILANAPINKTLRPCREESVDFDNTENLYIEGDNLEVLKLLQETYLGKIKMIYIDPPYNTGNDFVYNDEFGMRNEEWNEVSGNYDEDGNQITGKLEKNTESNGRFHTDWLNMIYPRLKLAKDLLTDDGVIFISIDDNEVENLIKCCNEIFGRSNFIANLIWKSKSGGANDSRYFAVDHEYIIVYAKSADKFELGIDKEATVTTTYNRKDEKGQYALDRLDKQSIRYSEALDYEIIGPDGTSYRPKHKDPTHPNATWRWSKKNVEQHYDDLVFENGCVYTKNYKKEGAIARSLLLEDRFGRTRTGKTDCFSLFNRDYFSNPKPYKLIRYFEIIASNKDSIILDFFSGSATTAHAVMQLNAEDGGHRKFIMVQLPEVTDEKSEAYKAGYKNICEIGKERIRRAGQKIRNEQLGIKNEGDNSSLQTPNSSLDTGFRVLKCDTSNMKDVYYNPAEYEPSLFSSLEDNIKEDRTPEDLLFQVMLDLGILLSSKIQVRSEKVGMRNYSYFDVEDGYLIACFDKNIDEEVITAIAKQKPYYFVMRDSSMATDSVATNFEQIFAAYSPDTVRKVL